MRVITSYLHGATMGTTGIKPKNPKPPKRGKVEGWSENATRRNVAFLRSIDENAITCTQDGELLQSYAVTLTLKDCPESAEEWHKLRGAFLKRMRRLGMHRCHWVTEWQRRGVPHLHGAFWFPHSDDSAGLQHKIIDHWLDLTYTQYGAEPRGQYIIEIYDSIGWFQYTAKHAARGVRHYQRSYENIPEGWQKKTGRVWGRTGDWPTVDPIKRAITDREFYTMRRLARSWRKADARSAHPEAKRFRIRSARRMLKCNDPDLSRLRGISEWIPQEKILLMLDVSHATQSRS